MRARARPSVSSAGSPPAGAPLLVIVAGPSCTGKTTLARRLSADLCMPFFSKDGFKELLFDQLGWSDRAWSQRLGAASIHQLYYAVEQTLAAHVSVIAESTFRARWDNQRVADLLTRHGARATQIQCVCDGPTLLARWRERTASGARHPGHVERDCEAEFAPGLLRGREEPLGIDGPVITLDTSDFAQVDYEGLAATLRAEIDRG